MQKKMLRNQIVLVNVLVAVVLLLEHFWGAPPKVLLVIATAFLPMLNLILFYRWRKLKKAE